MRSRLGCWLLAGALTVLGCLALSGCGEPPPSPAVAAVHDSIALCKSMRGIPLVEQSGWHSTPVYLRCDFPPQPCPPLPAEAP